MSNGKVSTYDKVNSISNRIKAIECRMRELEKNNLFFLFDKDWKQLNSFRKFLKKEIMNLLEDSVSRISNLDNELDHMQAIMQPKVNDKKFLS